jgi:hypothetical protein
VHETVSKHNLAASPFVVWHCAVVLDMPFGGYKEYCPIVWTSNNPLSFRISCYAELHSFSSVA